MIESKNSLSENNNDPISKRTVVLTSLVCLLPLLVGILLYPKFPEQMVTHWDAQGNPNGWESKFMGVIVFPGILFLIQLAMPFLIKADPRNKNLNPKIASLLCWIMPALTLLCSFSTICAGLGIDLNVQIITPVFIGLLFLVIGNYMPKMTQSYTVGIKLPWTLESEENWNRTHRLAGYLWTLGGLAMIVCAFFPFRAAALVVVILVIVLVPVIYSFCLYKKGI